MKIFMRNIGMTLHVIRKLRAQGLDNVKVNMDWQHLLMNGESLGEYAAMLAADGCSGTSTRTQAGARSTTTTWSERPRSWRRSSSRRASPCRLRREGERLGFDLYPYTEDAVAAVRRSVLQWRFIDSVAARIDDAALRAAQGQKDAVAAYESSTRRSASDAARRSASTSGRRVKAIALSPDGARARARRGAVRVLDPRPGWAEQDPEDWWRAAEQALADARSASRRRSA